MANELEIKRLLKEAAEKLIGRRLTDAEVAGLYRAYEAESGTLYEKAIKALSKTASFSERQIREKAASSDNLDRLMQDLKREAEKR